jgi:hypothetical protein
VADDRPTAIAIPAAVVCPCPSDRGPAVARSALPGCGEPPASLLVLAAGGEIGVGWY